MEELNDILNPQEPQEPETPEITEPAEPEPAPETGEPATSSPEEPPKKEEDPAAALRAEIAAEKAALTKERERVRAKEAALEAERQKLAQPQKPEEKPDFWEDPEARLTLERQTFQQELQRQRLEFSEMLAREKHSDFNEKLEVFGTLVQENPALYHQMLKEANPAGWAYDQAAKHLRLKEIEAIGDPQEYLANQRAQIEAEIRAKIAQEAEAAKAAEVEEAIKKKLPKSGFSELRSVGGGGGKNTYNGPTPLGAIIGSNK